MSHTPPAADRHYRLRWRSVERETERCAYMRELRRVMPPLTLKQIALAVKERYGTEYVNAKPMDHSSVWHHVQKKCCCDLWVRTASTAPATKSQGGVSATRSRDE